MSERVYLKLNRKEMHQLVASDRFGGVYFDYTGVNALEEINGTYQIGNSRGTVNIVWQPSTNKFFAMDVRSSISVLGTLMGYVAGFAGQRRGPRQVEGQYGPSQQPEVVEVLEAICEDYLRIPFPHPKPQSQSGSQASLESRTGTGRKEVTGREFRQLPHREPKKLKP